MHVDSYLHIDVVLYQDMWVLYLNMYKRGFISGYMVLHRFLNVIFSSEYVFLYLSLYIVLYLYLNMVLYLHLNKGFTLGHYHQYVPIFCTHIFFVKKTKQTNKQNEKHSRLVNDESVEGLRI